MSKIALLADLHIANHKAFGGPIVAGTNTRARLALRCLQLAVQKAQEHGCTAMYLAGDIFDTVKPEPQLIRAVQELLDVPMHIGVLMGNHDQVSTQAGDHSLGPLDPVADVVSTPRVFDEDGTQVVCVPFEPGPASGWLPARVRECAPDRGAVLVTHVGISTPTDPEFLRTAHDQVPAPLLGKIAAEHRLTTIAAGNWHTHRVFQLPTPDFAQAVQIGTLCPTGWDNPGLEAYGTMPILVDGVFKPTNVITIPGPRFINANLETKFSPGLSQLQVFVRFKVEADQVVAARSLGQQLVDTGTLAGFEVEVDDVEVRAAARTAATVARSADTTEDALRGFVEQMPLAEGIDRQAVLARAQDYLARGSK